MTHLHYVIAGYASVAVGLGGIFIWLLADRHRQRSALRQLDSLRQNGEKYHRNKRP